MQAQQRVQKEFKEIVEGGGLSQSGVEAVLINDDLSHWEGKIKGPIDTPYQGGTFSVDIQIPKKYPFVPPLMKFNTRIWRKL
jgi:ubiquitin-conjugating enzyme (huntingtin interacting protein 2)